MLRKFFLKNRNEQELKVIENGINETKDSSPCEAATLKLLRSAAKGWLPDDVSTCDETIKQINLLTENDNISAEELKSKFPKHFLNFNRCITADITGSAIQHFGTNKLEEDVHFAASVIEVNIESMELLRERQNPIRAALSGREIVESREVADNLRMFRNFHFKCRANGSKSSKDQAQVHLDMIKAAAKSLKR